VHFSTRLVALVGLLAGVWTLAALVGLRVVRNARARARQLVVLRSSGEQLRELQRQAMEADWTERRALERRLHDGAQSRLSALAMRLGAARHAARDPRTGTLLDDVQAELCLALDELREIAGGIHPTLLTESGLRPALESVVDRAPFPIHLVAPAQRFRPGVEAFAYYLICQVLDAAALRPVPTGVQVRVGSTADTMLIEISGRPEPAVEPWLRTAGQPFAVRLGAAGGTLAVTEDVGTGTTLRVRIPCL
jgi:signal transduction histidine kinase